MNVLEKTGPVQFITTAHFDLSHEELARRACSAGVKCIQYREKQNPQLSEVKAIQKICEAHGATLIVNDHIDLALKAEASGVHLGQHDQPIRSAREQLGDDAIIGGTANTMAHIQDAVEAGADYVGLGPFRPTASKQKLNPILGLEGYQNLLEQMKKASMEIPVFAIGGITTGDIPLLLNTGISGIALSSAIASAQDPEKKAKEIVAVARNP